MPNIILLEDEVALRGEVAAFMEKAGHQVWQAGCLAEFWPLMPEAEIALIDAGLPDGSGFDAVTRLRNEFPRVGVVMLTARYSMQDRLQGFQAGADHYLVKPFRLLELGAIIDALMRRIGMGWRLDLQSRCLIGPAGNRFELSLAELKLFELLTDEAGAVISRRTLVEALGHDWVDYDLRRLDTMISRLRHRWQTESGQVLPLRTEHRQGYSFGAVIQRV